MLLGHDETPVLCGGRIALAVRSKQLRCYPGIDPDMISVMKESFAAAQSRRREFGAFLRSRREGLAPEMVGLPEGTRRRTPGLRREEVALLARVGITWYTWLEQGRDVRASPEVLGALVRALRLNEAERQHLFALNGRTLPQRSTGPEIVPESLLRMLASLTAQPALVQGRRWDVLAWND